MVKVNELKLGNWVHFLGALTEIDEEFLYLLYDKKSDLESSDLDPIELTEEILFKCGFVINNGIFEKEGIRLHPIRNLYFRGNFPIKSDIKHLHQLQNLYFALTNKELEYEV